MLRNPPPTALNTYFLAVTTSPVAQLSPVLKRIHVQSSYASAVWLLAFSGTAVPADGSVPIMAPLRVAANAVNIFEEFGEGIKINPAGLVLVASSTFATLTKDASATISITAHIDEYESGVPSGESVAGDLTTGVSSLQVWTDANGPKTLKRALIKNNAASVLYAVLYAVNTPASTSRIVSWLKIAATTNVEWNFGPNGGVSPLQRDTNGTLHDGCVIAGQVDLVQGNVMAGTDFNIKATYA